MKRLPAHRHMPSLRRDRHLWFPTAPHLQKGSGDGPSWYVFWRKQRRACSGSARKTLSSRSSIRWAPTDALLFLWGCENAWARENRKAANEPSTRRLPALETWYLRQYHAVAHGHLPPDADGQALDDEAFLCIDLVPEREAAVSQGPA